MGLIRRPVTVEFSHRELPITDHQVLQRMQLMLELGRSEKVASLTIRHREKIGQRFVFEGVATIESADGPESACSKLSTPPARIGQPGGPQTDESYKPRPWRQRSAVA
jgi:hypothetical protein